MNPWIVAPFFFNRNTTTKSVPTFFANGVGSSLPGLLGVSSRRLANGTFSDTGSEVTEISHGWYTASDNQDGQNLFNFRNSSRVANSLTMNDIYSGEPAKPMSRPQIQS